MKIDLKEWWPEYLLAFVLGAALMGLGLKWAHSAELPLPKPRPVIEECVAPDVKPSAGQTMHVDPACPSGYRWRREK